MAYDVISSNLLIKGTKLAIVLDRDIQTDVPRFLSKHKECSNLKIDYLPIKSLEKYLRENLYVKVDNDLLSLLDTYIFQKKPLVDILRTYQKENEKDDSDGKILYGYLINELRSMRKERDDLIEMIVKFIMKSESSNVEELTSYLTSKINN